MGTAIYQKQVSMTYINRACATGSGLKGHGEVIHVVFDGGGVGPLQGAGGIGGDLVEALLPDTIITGPVRHLLGYFGLSISAGQGDLPTGQKQ